MTSTEQHINRWFDIPNGARDWLRPGERYSFYLPPELSDADRLAGWDQLAEWDRLVGRLTRAMLFDDTEDPRRLRKEAEAVAAVAQALAVRLGVE
jgi:hypothetical protein